MNTFRAAVIVPMVQVKLMRGLLESIAENDLRPVQIVIINNSGKEIPNEWSEANRVWRLNVTIDRPEAPMGVNESWARGALLLNRSHEIISFLNDDLLLGRKFFSGLSTAFHLDPKMGVACPLTVKRIEDLHAASEKELVLARMRKREGWAFTIRRDVFLKIPAFPSHEIKTFCGDDWIWYWTHRLGFYWCYMVQRFCFHYGSTTVKEKGLKAALKHEKREFAALLASLP